MAVPSSERAGEFLSETSTWLDGLTAESREGRGRGDFGLGIGGWGQDHLPAEAGLPGCSREPSHLSPGAKRLNQKQKSGFHTRLCLALGMECTLSALNGTIRGSRGDGEDGRRRTLLYHHPGGHLMLSLRVLVATLDVSAGGNAHNFPKTNAKTGDSAITFKPRHKNTTP